MRTVYICILLMGMGLGTAYGQADTARPARKQVYFVDWWVTAPIIAVGGTAGLLWINYAKPNITNEQLADLNPSNVPFFDRISLHQNIALVPSWDKAAKIGQIAGAAMPLLILLDPDVRPDWVNVVAIGLEVNMVELGLYSISPIGPHFIDRYRPLVYYSNASQYGIYRNDGINTASWYSGHVGSVAASSFFMAKVYCDYHPDANEVLAYGAAAIPPLAMGVIRFMTLDHFPSDIAFGFALGAAIGIIDPQLHRTDHNKLSLGLFSSPERGTGLALRWDLSERSDTSDSY